MSHSRSTSSTDSFALVCRRRFAGLSPGSCAYQFLSTRCSSIPKFHYPHLLSASPISFCVSGLYRGYAFFISSWSSFQPRGLSRFSFVDAHADRTRTSSRCHCAAADRVGGLGVDLSPIASLLFWFWRARSPATSTQRGSPFRRRDRHRVRNFHRADDQPASAEPIDQLRSPQRHGLAWKPAVDLRRAGARRADRIWRSL